MAEDEVLADNDGAEEPTATSSVNGKQYDKFLKEFEKSQTASADAVRDEGTDKNGDGTLPV